jgi:hypothetical protein
VECKYSEKPYWDDLNNQHTYHCDEIPSSTGYCIFHEENFLNESNPDYVENVKKIKTRFIEKFNRCINEGKEMLFIGYILPDLELPKVRVDNILYFMYSRFR